MITHPASFNDQLRDRHPLPPAGGVGIEEALRKLTEIVERDRATLTGTQRVKPRYRPPTACVGM